MKGKITMNKEQKELIKNVIMERIDNIATLSRLQEEYRKNDNDEDVAWAINKIGQREKEIRTLLDLLIGE